MNDLTVLEKPAEWDRFKQMVLDRVSSPITKRVYNMALEEFLAWFGEPLCFLSRLVTRRKFI